MTVQEDIIFPALRLARVTGGPGRTASPDQVAEAFSSLNRMIDGWSTLRGLIYSIRKDEYTLTPPRRSYTIGRGAGADFVADRPTRIENANAVIQSGPTKTYIPMHIMDFDEWAAVRVRDFPTTFPSSFYPDYGVPNCTLYMWGIPSGSPGLELWTWQQADLFDSEMDTVLVPPGYLEAAVSNLAVRMGEAFGTTAEMSPTTFQTAKQALARVKALNTPSPTIASADAGTRGQPRGDFSYLSGGPA